MTAHLLMSMVAIRTMSTLLVQGDSSFHAGNTLVRYQTKHHIGPFSLEGAVEAGAWYGQAAIFSDYTDIYPQYFHWSREVARGKDALLLAYVDRLSVKWSTGPMDITAGRQAITTGRGHQIALLDVFVPFAPYSIDFSFKRGVDAIRVDWMWGNAYGTYVFSTAARHTLVLGTTMGEMDIQTIAVQWRDTLFGGYSLEGNLESCGRKGLWDHRDGLYPRAGTGL